MARILRIDSVAEDAGGVHFGITASDSDLPAGRSKQGLSFSSQAALVAAIKALEDWFSDEDLMLLMIASVYKNTGTLAGLEGKTIKMALTGAGASLVKIT